VVLEGGYDLGALSRSLCDVLETFAADDPPARPDVPVHPAAAEAQRRLASRWPALA
jgi:acetoin utilization deacetylase AcuC-like enzyme